MPTPFADRMSSVHRSFVREILKVTEKPEIISFAGGLPSPLSFPVDQVAKAAEQVFSRDGAGALQYATTEGFLPLRQYIAGRYREKKGINVGTDDILITSGSQQALDLIGKIFINKGDTVVLERPGYLGAIQSFSVFEPRFIQIPLLDDGIYTGLFEKTIQENKVKFFYTVPNFQNPSGITYSEQKRRDVAAIAERHGLFVVEDDPYGELRFMGSSVPPIRSFLPETGILLGTFSKVVAPGLRLGWICAPKPAMEKLIVAKQAADLHSSNLAQRIVYAHLEANDLDAHLLKVRRMYKRQRDLMVSMIESHFPVEVQFTRPEGGMFIWVTMPEKYSSLELLDLAIRENVAFVPGNAFFTSQTGGNTMRLNFSNSDEHKIEEGIKRLGKVMKQYFATKA